MENYYRYIIIASLSISVLYIAYQLLFRKENNFKIARLYLLACLLFSLLLPFNKFSIQLDDNDIDGKYEVNELTRYEYQNNIDLSSDLQTEMLYDKVEIQNSIPKSEIKSILFSIYISVSLLLLSRILFSIGKIVFYYVNSERKKCSGHHILIIDKNTLPFSFLNMIFISKSDANKDLNEILEHEKTHAKQYHTIDILLIELLVAAMWFNPFIWMYKRALVQVHEFLADEGALNSGVDQLAYQSLLVNQAAEERLVPLSSNFSYSLIKKRIIMISKKKKHGRIKFKLIALIPIITFLFIGIALFNEPIEASPANSNSAKILKNGLNDISSTSKKMVGNKDVLKENLKVNEPNQLEQNEKTLIISEPGNLEDTIKGGLIAAVSLTKMNVLYLGVDNPVSVGVTGAQNNNIKVSIDNGTIEGNNGKYIARVKNKDSNATISVIVDGKVVSQEVFRVKTVPDPIAVAAGKRGGPITKEELLSAKGVNAVFNSDFDLKFEIVEFTVSASLEGGFVQDAKQLNGSVFTKNQIGIISRVGQNNKVYIEGIKAKGPDGTIRDLGAIAFKIK